MTPRDRYRRIRAAIRKADRFQIKGKVRRAFLARAIRRCFPAPRQS